jgi:hypothetical protein
VGTAAGVVVDEVVPAEREPEAQAASIIEAVSARLTIGILTPDVILAPSAARGALRA